MGQRSCQPRCTSIQALQERPPWIQRRETPRHDFHEAGSDFESHLVHSSYRCYRNCKLYLLHKGSVGLIACVQASQKSRAGFSVAQYTYDWSVVVQDFVKKQLAEMVVPDMTPSSTIGSTVRSRSKRVLADSGLRLTWTAKFSYT